MIAYLDTSALVKLYVSEEGSRAVRARVRGAEAVATSALAYAETRSAFARLVRSGHAGARQHAQRVRRFNLDWDDYMRVEVAPELIREAGDLAELHALRAFDGIHLASALWLKDRAAASVVFAVYDRRLHAAAEGAGLRVFPRRLSGRA